MHFDTCLSSTPNRAPSTDHSAVRTDRVTFAIYARSTTSCEPEGNCSDAYETRPASLCCDSRTRRRDGEVHPGNCAEQSRMAQPVIPDPAEQHLGGFPTGGSGEETTVRSALRGSRHPIRRPCA